MPDLRLNWSQWLYAVVSAFIGGGASAVSGGIVVSAYDPKDFNFGDTKIYGVMLFMFSFNGLLNAFFYLKQHPLPEVITTTTTTETSILSTRPPTTMVKTVEEKVVGTPPPEVRQ
jgi:hypothetical protein